MSRQEKAVLSSGSNTCHFVHFNMQTSVSRHCCECGDDGNAFCIMFLEQVVSIEKMEDTSLLPNPIIISIRSKMAFQFIELKDRDSLVENLLQRLKQVNAGNPVYYNSLKNKDTVLSFCIAHCLLVIFGYLSVILYPSVQNFNWSRKLVRSLLLVPFTSNLCFKVTIYLYQVAIPLC